MNNWKEKTRGWRTPGFIIAIGSLIITGIGFVFNAVVENNKIQVENRQLQFQSVEQRVKTSEHVNTPYTPVNLYIQGEKMLEQTILIEKVLKDNRINDSLRRIDKIIVNKSRASRDSSQIIQAQKAEEQALTMKKILKFLDTTQ